jgi:hypothetical protein
MFSNKIGVFIDNNHIDLRNPYKVYDSLAELNAEWEDYEELKHFYFIRGDGGIAIGTKITENICRCSKEIGNYFETREEAEAAVEKLKAWKRLKDKGFRFKDYERNMCDITIRAKLYDDGEIGMIHELNLLFGGEE